jgi:NADH dehydrogenase
MNVLVTGGTGFLGQAVVRQLHHDNHHVHLLARNPHAPVPNALAAHDNVTVHGGNLLDPPSIPPAVANLDAVIHLVGIISEIGPQTFQNVHVNATRNLLDASRDARIRRFIHVSALGARPGAASRYHRTKWDAEQIVRRADLSWTVFRPGIIYGPNDGFVCLFARISRWSPVIPLIGGGLARFQPVRVEDVATSLVGALTEPQARGQTFDLCGHEILTLRQIVDSILTVTQRKRLKLAVPVPLARAQAPLLEAVFTRLLKRPSPLNRDQIIMLQEDNLGDPQPATDLFNLPRVPFADGLAAFLRPNTAQASML